MKFLNLDRQSEVVKAAIQERFNRIIRASDFILGDDVFEMEEALAEFTGSRFCISCSSGTDALLMSLMALDVKAGDEVITTSFSFFSTVEVVLRLGATPVFVDIDPSSGNLNADLVREACSDKTKAIIAVNLYGNLCDYSALLEICRDENVWLVEDAAQSFGAWDSVLDRASCSLGHISCTSFFPAKPLGCFGDGGAIFTDDGDLARKLKAIRVHGQEERYNHHTLGIGGRMDTMQAAVIIEKLARFPEELSRRQFIVDSYDSVLQSFNIKRASGKLGDRSANALYTILPEQRQVLIEQLKKVDIPFAVHYPTSMPDQVLFEGRFKNLKIPFARSMSQTCISLPVDPYFFDVEIDEICARLGDCFRVLEW